MVSVGDLVVDLLLDVKLPVLAAQHQTARALKFEAGGACTTILAARAMGLQVAALGTVGDDAQGRMLLEILAEAAVDTAALQTPPGSTTTTVVALTDTAGGGHVFLGYYGIGADIGMNERAGELLAAADAVFVPGYTLVEERLGDLVTGVYEQLARSKRRVYFDVGPFLGKSSPAQAHQALSVTDVLLLTADEIPFVTLGDTGVDACRGLLERHPALTIVLKLAETGCRIMTRDLDLACPGFAIDLVDTVGAGDAFAGAFIWADLQRHSPAECGTIANAMGAASVQKAGAGRNVPTCAEVQRILDDDNTGINLSC